MGTNNQEIGHDQRAALYAALAKVLGCASLMERALAGLEGKRVTLEEKMIRTYLIGSISAICEYVSSVHSKFDNTTCDIDVDVLTRLDSLTQEMEPVFQELVRTIEYDWNYLEQYYEHDFYARLSNEYKFKERLQELPSCVRI